MQRFGMHNRRIDVGTHLVLELFNHNTKTFGSCADFGIVEAILDFHGSSHSIL